MNVNKATIVGRVCHTPELKTTQSGKVVCQTSIATNFSWKDSSGAKQEKTQFHNVVIWGKLAEVFVQYVEKGQEVFIEGRLETRSYDDKNGGAKRYVTEIVAENMQMGSKANGSGRAPMPADESNGAVKTTSTTAQEEEIRLEDVPF
ncbi:MAG: hypothetical protein ACD_5C00075G0003 [uncultured bacterium]|nr:MAG: hypothetical protein ACD_5C00075G0003 [uncultured bacterium]